MALKLSEKTYVFARETARAISPSFTLSRAISIMQLQLRPTCYVQATEHGPTGSRTMDPSAVPPMDRSDGGAGDHLGSGCGGGEMVTTLGFDSLVACFRSGFIQISSISSTLHIPAADASVKTNPRCLASHLTHPSSRHCDYRYGTPSPAPAATFRWLTGPKPGKTPRPPVPSPKTSSKMVRRKISH